MKSLELCVEPGRFAVCRLASDAAVPDWCSREAFTSITRTADELSIVCAERLVPPDVRAHRGWSCLAVAGPLDFAEVGVLSAICNPLAAARISLFAVSTFDTDYVLVREKKLADAIETLAQAGHRVRR